MRPSDCSLTDSNEDLFFHFCYLLPNCLHSLCCFFPLHNVIISERNLSFNCLNLVIFKNYLDFRSACLLKLQLFFWIISNYYIVIILSVNFHWFSQITACVLYLIVFVRFYIWHFSMLVDFIQFEVLQLIQHAVHVNWYVGGVPLVVSGSVYRQSSIIPLNYIEF